MLRLLQTALLPQHSYREALFTALSSWWKAFGGSLVPMWNDTSREDLVVKKSSMCLFWKFIFKNSLLLLSGGCVEAEYNRKRFFNKERKCPLTPLNKDRHGALLSLGDNTVHSASKSQWKKRSRRESRKKEQIKERKAGQQQFSGTWLWRILVLEYVTQSKVILSSSGKKPVWALSWHLLAEQGETVVTWEELRISNHGERWSTIHQMDVLVDKRWSKFWCRKAGSLHGTACVAHPSYSGLCKYLIGFGDIEISDSNKKKCFSLWCFNWLSKRGVVNYLRIKPLKMGKPNLNSLYFGPR